MANKPLKKQSVPSCTLLILGAGGLGIAVAEIARCTGAYTRICFLDDTTKSVAGFEVLGHCELLPQLCGKFTHAIAAFGNNALRRDYTQKIKSLGFDLPTVIHPSAVISPSAHLAAGCIVRENVAVSHTVNIEEGCLLNMGCLIDHNCSVGAYSHIPMGVILRNAVSVAPGSAFKPGEVIEVC